MAKSGKGDDACKRGKRGRLSGRASPRLERGGGASLHAGVGAPPDRGARTGASAFPAATVRWRVIPLAALVGAVVAIVAIVALTLQHLALERDLALGAAEREIAMRATLLAQRLDAALAAEPLASAAEIFRRVLDAHPEERFAKSILIDRNGRLGRIRPDPFRRQFAARDPGGRPKGRRRGRRLGRRDSLQNGRRRGICRRAGSVESLGAGRLRLAGRSPSRCLAPNGAGDHLPAGLDRRADDRGGMLLRH